MSAASALNRRRFLGVSAKLGVASLPLSSMLLGACSSGKSETQLRKQAGLDGYGPLQACPDENTGLMLLKLPAGFRYRTFGWTGTELQGGFRTPAAHDGMGVVRQQGRQVTLIRNHEVTHDRGAFGDLAQSYDPNGAGGCVAFEFDLDTASVSNERCVLSGTAINCAGGVTPWGTWLSGEEVVFSGGNLIDVMAVKLGRPGWQRDHGYLFEAHPDRPGPAVPITAAGMFKHEAAAVHKATGDVYLTEDNNPEAGLYRLIPNEPGNLQAGGRLQMLAVKERRDMRSGIAPGMKFSVYWVDIDEPTRGHSPGKLDGRGVFAQGFAAGGAQFTRGEGIVAHGDQLWFTCTIGGDAGRGQVFALDLNTATLTLIFEAKSQDQLDMPDNLIVSPQGGLVICEDNDLGRAQKLVGMNQDGRVFDFCESNVDLTEHRLPGIAAKDYRWEEWAGVCFSPDGKWMFANVYDPGFTVAITGPWENGPL